MTEQERHCKIAPADDTKILESLQATERYGW